MELCAARIADGGARAAPPSVIVILQLPYRIGGRQRVKTGGRIGDDSLLDILRRDPDRHAALAAVMRQRCHDVIRNHRKRGRKRRRHAHQASRVEAGQEAIRYLRVYVAGSQALLLESRGAELVERRRVAHRERLGLVGEAGEGRQSEDRVDRLDHGVMIALHVRDGVRPRIGRDEDQRHADSPGKRQIESGP